MIELFNDLFKLIPGMNTMICFLSKKRMTNREHSSNSPPHLSSQGEELRWKDPRVEGSLDNRVVDVAPLSVTHRVGDVISPILVYAEYTPVGITPISWACWKYHSLSGQQVERVLGGVQPNLIMV